MKKDIDNIIRQLGQRIQDMINKTAEEQFPESFFEDVVSILRDSNAQLNDRYHYYSDEMVDKIAFPEEKEESK